MKIFKHVGMETVNSESGQAAFKYPIVKSALPLQGAQVQLLAGEIRSLMSRGQQKRGEGKQLGMVRQPGTSRTGKLQPPLGRKGQVRAWCS